MAGESHGNAAYGVKRAGIHRISVQPGTVFAHGLGDASSAFISCRQSEMCFGIEAINRQGSFISLAGAGCVTFSEVQVAKIFVGVGIVIGFSRARELFL